MKIFLDNEFIYEISNFDIKVLSSEINRLLIKETIKKRLKWDIESLCDQYYKNLKDKWLPVLFKRYTSIPTSNEELLEIIISQPDYKEYLEEENCNIAETELKFTES